MTLIKKILNRLRIYSNIIRTRFTTIPNLYSLQSEWYAYKLLTKKLDWCNIEWKEHLFLESLPKDVKLNKTIFVYWNQGFENAPEIVKKCVESIKKHSRDYYVVYLTSDNLAKYITLPNHIIRKHDNGIIQEAIFSDMVRTCLLVKYGGIWCDATCLWVDEIPDYIYNSRLFFFRTPKLGKIYPGEISNWFIKAERGNEVLLKTLNFLFEWHRRYDYICHYYIYHLALSAIINNNISRDGWDEMPYINNMNPHTFYFHWDIPYAEALYNQLLNSCFVQKLSYKFDKNLLETNTENMIQHFMNS